MEKSEKMGLEGSISKTSSSRTRPMIIIFAVAVVIIGGGIFLLRSLNPTVSPLGSTNENQVSLTAPTGGEKVEPEKILEDEWGFKVSYPQSLKVLSATGSGELTRWEFTSTTYDGKVSIWSKETSYEGLEDWLEGDKSVAGTTGSLDSALGGELAKKINLDNPRRVWIATIDNGQLFVIEFVPGSDRNMEKAFNRMVESFEFLPFPTQPASVKNNTAPPADEGGVEEESEEVVE